jgi:hypothetical protein
MSNKHSPLHNSANHGTIPYKRMDPIYHERNKASFDHGVQPKTNNHYSYMKKDFRSIDYHLNVLVESSLNGKSSENIAHDYITGK